MTLNVSMADGGNSFHITSRETIKSPHRVYVLTAIDGTPVISTGVGEYPAHATINIADDVIKRYPNPKTTDALALWMFEDVAGTDLIEVYAIDAIRGDEFDKYAQLRLLSASKQTNQPNEQED